MEDTEQNGHDNFIMHVMTKDINGLPVWVWLLVVLVGLGFGIAAHKHFSKNKDDKGDAPSAAVNDNDNPGVPGVPGDNLEGGMPIMASQTNTALPYAGLPANTYAIVSQGGLTGIPLGMMVPEQQPWHFHHGKFRRDEHHRKHDMKNHNLEAHGSTVAARVGGH